MSYTTIALDQFSDTSGTDLTAHSPDSGITTWAGFAGLWVIDESGKARTATALARRIGSINDIGPTSGPYTVVGEVTRPDTETTGSACGFQLSGNTTTTFNDYKYGRVLFTSVGSLTRLVYSYQSWTGGGGAGLSRNITNSPDDIADTGTYGWPSNGSKRIGVVYGGGVDSIATVWMENLDGSAYTESTGTSFATTTYDFPATVGLKSIGLSVDMSGTTDFWKVDNFAVYDGAYYGVGGTVRSLSSMVLSWNTFTDLFAFTAGTGYLLKLTVFDDSNDTLSNYTGTVTIRTSHSSYSIPGSYSFTTASAGSAFLGNFIFYTAPELSELSVFDASRTTIGDSSAISCNPSIPFTLELDLLETSAEKGDQLSSVLTLRDQRGNLCTNATGDRMEFRSTDPTFTTSVYTMQATDLGVASLASYWQFYSEGTQYLGVVELAGLASSRTTDSVYIRGTWNPPPGPSVTTYVTQSRITQGWQQLSELTDAQGYVDFILRVQDQYPMVVSDTNPAYLIESGDTGRP